MVGAKILVRSASGICGGATMGFPVEDVLSQEGHTTEFICAICQCLVEYPKMTPCSHVFCTGCIDEWMKRKRSCPTCKTSCDGAAGQPQDLKQA